jgi:phosphopantetheinyl transferase
MEINREIYLVNQSNIKILMLPLLSETTEEFRQVKLNGQESLHKRRISEKATVQKLFQIAGIEEPLQYLNKKPTLPSGKYFISISHNNSHAAIAISKFPCGIDIEAIHERVMKIRHKFLSSNEMKLTGDDIFLNTLCWSVKEAAYKWNNELKDFQSDINICSIHKEKQFVSIQTHQQTQIVNYLKIPGDMILCWLANKQ